MKKKLFGLLVLVLLSAPLQSLAAYNQGTAQSYLLAHASNPWSTMALAAVGANNVPSDYLKTISGTNAIDFAAPVLAMTAVGKDPRSFAGTDLVAKIESFKSNGQMGDPTTLNDDIFCLLALVSAGVPQADPNIVDVKNFLLAHQNANGGWGFATSGTSDSNMTSAGVVALVAAGVEPSDSHLQSALAYLKIAQNSDGGFTYDPASTFGTDSDSSSTSWAMWALTSLGIDQATVVKNNNTAAGYLESNQTAAGYFSYQNGSPEDAFSATTTAYAVIAMAGKTLPISIFSAGSGSGSGGSTSGNGFRIEGADSQVCSGTIVAITALDVVKNASTTCNFTYHIQTTSFGPYLNQINNDKAAGLVGWVFLVNNVAPQVGAGDYQLQSGDQVLWYYGDFSWLPSRISLSKTTIDHGSSTQATVESFSGGAWTPVSGATVFVNSQTITANSGGVAVVSPPDGNYKVFAEKTGFIRSNAVDLRVGSSAPGSVQLSVTISGSGRVEGSSIGFTVNPDSVDFGTLKPTQSSDKSVSVHNTGQTGLVMGATVSGDSVFTDNVTVAGTPWKTYSAFVPVNGSKDAGLSLAVPSGYNGGNGSKQGQIIFWATAQ